MQLLGEVAPMAVDHVPALQLTQLLELRTILDHVPGMHWMHKGPARLYPTLHEVHTRGLAQVAHPTGHDSIKKIKVT